MARSAVEVSGLKELSLSFKELAEKTQRNVDRRATRAAANVMRDSIRRFTPIGEGRQGGKYPHRPGNLRRSIGVTETGRGKDWKGFKVGPRTGGQTDGFYGGWVELGHLKARGKKIGRGQRTLRQLAEALEFGDQSVPPHPFMRPGFEAGKRESLRVYEEKAKQGFGEALNQVARRPPES